MNKAPLLERLCLLARRNICAVQMGVNFPGTKRFKLPETFRLNGRTLRVAAPDERGLAYDFMNLALDDEYGLRRLRTPPATILDVGANIGMFSLMSAALFPAAKIHAYEPNPRIQKYAESNLAQVKAELFPEAVGAKAGTGEMCDTGDSRSGVFTSGGSIKVIPLAEAVRRLGGSVDLLKLDCEGAEWDIFEDAQVFRNIVRIRMEYHLTGGKTLSDLESQASKLGFTMVKLEKNDGFGIAWLDRASCA